MLLVVSICVHRFRGKASDPLPHLESIWKILLYGHIPDIYAYDLLCVVALREVRVASCTILSEVYVQCPAAPIDVEECRISPFFIGRYHPLAVKGCPLTTPTGGPGIRGVWLFFRTDQSFLQKLKKRCSGENPPESTVREFVDTSLGVYTKTEDIH